MDVPNGKTRTPRKEEDSLATPLGRLSGKTILVTGGTGSFGRELVDCIIESEFSELRIFSRDELKQELMRNELCNSKVKFIIGDVRERHSVDQAMKGVDLVFHAAALKQVPSCEFFPMQAVLTNVIGSNHVIEMAIKHKVQNIVCLSTDKAVCPINAMGMTKALMEKSAMALAMSSANSGTRHLLPCATGNVIFSRGSVLPLFIRQIKGAHPLTVTDPQMTRFMLTLREAIDLVLFASRTRAPGRHFHPQGTCLYDHRSGKGD